MNRVLLAMVTVMQLLAAGAADAQVARVLRIDGAAMVDEVGQARRFLGIGEQLNEKSVITVAKESFVMLEFRDESRVTLRPNTVFRLDSFVDSAPESIRFGLAKGGLRAVSGLVGKRKPEVVQINTTNAWIGIRGTEFDVRLCEQDCASEDRAAAPPTKSRATVAARVVEIDGIAIATGSTLPTRGLTPGAMIYERDTIATAPAAYVVLAFPDGSRVSVSANSVVAIQQFRFDETRPEQNAAQLRLLEGGLRVMTGRIAQRKPEAYRIDTAIAPVDPRGTLFDAFCTGACVDPKSNARAEMLRVKEQADRLVAQANAEAGVTRVSTSSTAFTPAPVATDGLVVHAIDGIVLTGSEGAERVQVANGATVLLSERGAPPRFASQTLAYIAQNKAPRPDLVTVDPALFDQQKAQTYDPGMYVWVREGVITLQPIEPTAEAPASGQPLRLAAAPGITSDAGATPGGGSNLIIVRAGQVAHLTPARVSLLPTVPTFMRFDPTPPPTRANVPVNAPASFRARDGSSVGQCTP